MLVFSGSGGSPSLHARGPGMGGPFLGVLCMLG